MLCASLALQAQQVAKTVCALMLPWPVVMLDGRGEPKRAGRVSLLVLTLKLAIKVALQQ